MPPGSLLTVFQFLRKCHLPGWMLFQYSQLQHADRLQFPQMPVLQTDPIEELITQSDLCKPLSALYAVPLCINSSKVERLQDLGKADIAALDQEDWEDCLEA